MGILQNGEMKVVATDLPWLMAMTVATDWHHHLPKTSLERHVADFNNIAGDAQVTLTITKAFEIYVYKIA